MTETAALPGAGEPTDDELTSPPRRSVGRRILSGLLTYGIVVVAIAYLLGEMSAGSSWSSALARITPWMLAASVVLGVVNLATNWPPIAVALPGLRLREAAVTNTASAALSNTVPEGGAVATGLNYAMLRSWGFSLGDITSEVLVTGTWSQLMKYTLLAIGLVAVAVEGWGPSYVPWVALGLAALVAVALVVLGLVLHDKAFAVRLGRWGDAVASGARHLVHRIPATTMVDQVPTFREALVTLLRVCWARLTTTMLVSQLTVVVVLGLCCRMQGLDESTISWAVILVAWGLVTFASLLVPTPGGLGVAEIVLVGVLGYGLPQSDQAAVLAAVLLYRIATFLVPIPIGLVTYLYWRRSSAWRHAPGTRGPSAQSRAAAAA